MDDLCPEEIKSVNKNGGSAIEMCAVNKKSSEKLVSSNGEIFHDHLEYEPSGWLETTLEKATSSTEDFFQRNKEAMRIILVFVFNGLVIGFFFASLYYWLNFSNQPLELCNGFGSLIAFLSIVYFFVIYFLVVKRYFGEWYYKKVWSRVEATFDSLWKIRWFRWCLSLAVFLSLSAFLVWDSWGTPQRLMSLIGLFIIILLGFTFSSHPGRVKWRTVLMGLLIQVLFGILFIRWEPGRLALQCFSDKVC